jgi:glycopeptide antibiotics resistance protein
MFDSSFALFLLSIIGIPILIVVNIFRKKSFVYHVISVIAVVYFAGVISVTLFPIPIDSGRIEANREAGIHIAYNIIPFHSIVQSYSHSYHMVGIRNILGNLLLLLPFGFLMGIAKINKLSKVFLYGFLVSLMIECFQLLLTVASLFAYRRAVDIDDLILNTIGCGLGYLVFAGLQEMLNRIFRSKKIMRYH